MKLGIFLLSTMLYLATAVSVSAQSKFFSSSSRGGAEGAKQNAQVSTLQGENERMNTCTAAGRIYAPTHPNRDTNDCIPHLTLNPTTGAAAFSNRVTINSGVTVNSGGATVTGNSTFNNNLTVGGATTVNNSLNVTGTATFGNNMTVNGRVTAGQLFVGSGNIGAIPNCTSSQKLHWNGTAWNCVTDNVGATAATEVDPKVGNLSNARWCRSDGSRVHCDVAPPIACAGSQKLQWTGSSWTCASDQGITVETDPKVGTLTAGRWCTSDGARINCTSTAPTGSTTTTSSGGTASCPAGNVSWGSCSGYRNPGLHGAVMTVSDPHCNSWTFSSDWWGSATFTCLNGTWVMGGNSCQQAWCSGGDDFGDW